MKGILNGALRALAAVLSFVGIALGFIFSGSLITSLLDSALHVRVDPRLSGGEIAQSFMDPAGDDRGYGRLSYPVGERFAEAGSLDIVKYMVYEPIVGAPWSDEEDFWQLGLVLAAMPDPDRAPDGFSIPTIRIYIDTDGAASGSVGTADPRAELVSFDPAFPWDIAVEIDGWHARARVRTASGLEREARIFAIPERRSLWVRIPLDIPEAQRVLDGRSTRHYVMTAIWSPAGPVAAKEEASASSGGGSAGALTPRVYDLLAPDAESQYAMLSSWDDAAYAPPVVRPVEARGRAVAGDGSAASADAKDLEALRAAAEIEAKEAGEKARAASERALAEATDDSGRLPHLFALGKRAEAEVAARAVLSSNPDDALALAYLGSLIAMKGGESGNPAQAVVLVNEAFASLDRAASLSAGSEPGTRVAVLMNRASVAASVPNEVFAKVAVAAADFEAIAALQEGRDAADSWVRSGIARLALGDEARAEVDFARALSIADRGAWASYELAKRGYAAKAPAR